MNPLLLLWCGCFWLYSAVVFAKEPPKEYLLDNGLKLIVQEDHRAPAAMVQVWYKVGSQDEESGTTGISHMLEHLMFKGTTRYPDGSFAVKIAGVGGVFNAETTQDYTMYFSNVAASQLEMVFDLEADRMRHLEIKKTSFLPERSVVAEERRLRIEDDPDAMLLERLYAAAFLSSGYHHPTTGWMNEINSFTTEDAHSWYMRWYGPNNAVVVVAGDVEPSDVLALAKRTFGSLSPITLKERKMRVEQQPLGIKKIIVKRRSQLPQVLMGYLVPVLTTVKDPTEAYALFVLAKILGGSDTSRFTKELVRGQQLAVSAVADYSPLERSDSLFMIGAIPNDKTTLTELALAIKTQILALQNNLVEERELDRIKIGVTASKIYAQDSLEGQARTLGLYQILGLSHELSDQFVEKVQAVTPAQVQAVARKYLQDDALTLAELHNDQESK